MADTLSVEMNAEIQKAVTAAMSPEAIKEALLAEAQRQQAATQQTEADKQAAAAAKADADKKAAEAAAAANQPVFTRTLTINGRDFSFEADTELELEKLVNNAYAVASAYQQTPEPVQQTQDEPTEAQKKAAADAEIARRADLELKFKRGEISTADYLEQTNAVEEHLAKKGISIEKLKETVEHTELEQEKNSWASATTEFLATSDWPGGDRNLNLIGMQIEKMDLLNAEDKVGALRQAYAELKSKNMLFVETPQTPQTSQPNAEAERQAAERAAAAERDRLANAERERAAAAAAVRPTVTPSTSSSLWSRSSGVGDTTSVVKPTENVEIPKDASPAEILDAWKRAQLAQGINPDDAFKQTFARNPITK